jgi:uncharacterized protein
MSRSHSSVALLFQSRHGQHLFVTDRSRVYDLSPDLPLALQAELAQLASQPNDVRMQALLDQVIGDVQARDMLTGATDVPPLRALSLNLAQSCNMACSYCYADEGRFGGTARSMGLELARASVDRLLAESTPGDDLVLGFIGGEPLLNRKVFHAVTAYAASAASAAGRRMRFSLTTNATLITPADARLLHEHGFHVSVSLDGLQQGNDAQRPMRDGSSAYAKVLRSLAMINAHGRPRHLAARVTVTPRSGALLPILQHHLELGFDSVGFAATLTSPDPSLAFGAEDFEHFTQDMLLCGRHALAELMAGRSCAFGNLETALQEIHQGSHRPFPCGAGAGYMSVAADGRLYACHRVIDEPAWQMGDVNQGIDNGLRHAHLERRHVDKQEPCRSCWARYLCGGGCYHEVERRGRLACDYIRSWLSFCLEAYTELSTARPAYFQQAAIAGEHNPSGVR